MEKQLRIIARLLAILIGGDADKTLAEAEGWAERTTPAKSDEETNEAVERLYKMYPTKDSERGQSTGKCSKDKARLRTLLKTKTEEQIAYTIRRYLQESAANRSYIKNFSTFLNNMPEYDNVEEEAPAQPQPLPQIAQRAIQQPDGMDDYIRERQSFYDNL